MFNNGQSISKRHVHLACSRSQYGSDNDNVGG